MPSTQFQVKKQMNLIFPSSQRGRHTLACTGGVGTEDTIRSTLSVLG